MASIKSATMRDPSSAGTTDARTTSDANFVYGGGATINPDVPYCEKLEKFNPGDIIIINGQLRPASKHLIINLQEMETTSAMKNIQFHCSVRLHQGVIVRNSQTQGAWETEERNGGMCNMEVGKPFECMIMLHTNCYKVAFNGIHLSDFEHRSPHKNISHLAIEGNIDLRSVQIQAGPESRDVQNNLSAMPLVPTKNPEKDPKDIHQKIEADMNEFPMPYGITLPYSEFIPGGLRLQRVLYISGIPSNYPNQFTVDLKLGRIHSHTDIALHFKVQMPQKIIVLNSKEAGKWGPEQRITDRFPFQKGVHYDLLILCLQDSYRISINNQHFTEYKHRVKKLDTVTGLEITGTTKVVHVRLL